MVLRSGLMMAIIYAVVVVGILLVIPKSTLSSVTGFVAAYRHVATTLGGSAHAFGYFFAILILLSIISSTAVWLEGADRTQAVAALDGNAPTWVGKFSSVGTPIAVNLMSGIIASAFVFFVFILAKGSLSSFFAVMLSLVISTTALSYLFMFPALVVLRKKYPDHPRPYKVPGGTVGAWVAVVLTELFVVITAITLLWPGLLNNMLGQSYSIESSWGVSRAYFEEVTLGSLAVMILLAIVFWWFGRRALAKGTVGENDLLELPGSKADLEGGSDS
jgi:amino acid transporter